MVHRQFVAILSLTAVTLAQTSAVSQQTTLTTFSALPTEFVSPGSVLNCVASMRCDERVGLGEYSDNSCKFGGIECQCVAWNSTGYSDCLKEKCPDNWEVMRDEKLKLCTDLKVDLSGNTTYTGIAMPTSSTNVGIVPANDKDEDEGLSTSDKIAIGVGVGFGVPTIVVGLGAWLCARRRKDKKEVEEYKMDDDDDRLTP